jgi:hypothetical protein
MTDTTLKQAIQEAYATAPSSDVILHTLEIRHPAFVDQNSQPTAIRVVQNYVDLTAMLENTAPLNPAQNVTFISFAFDVQLPEVTDVASPEIIITMDNVSSEIETNIALATASGTHAQITYRAYLSSDLTGPQNDPPLTMTVFDIKANDFSVTCTCGFSDAANKLFPGEFYTPQRFPSLAR